MNSKDNEFTPDEEKISFPSRSEKSNETSGSIDNVVESSDLENDIKKDDINKSEINDIATEEVELGKSPKKKSFFKRFTIYSIMTLLTFGIWPRFKPLRSGVSGSWFIFVLFLLSITAFLATERFFKQEFNSKMTEQFGESAVTIPEKLFFEANDDSIDYKEKHAELIVKYEQLNQSYNKLDKADLSPVIEDLAAKNESLSRGLAEANSALEIANNELDKPPEAPDMAFVTFNELDSIVGCSSKYAERKKVDIFNKDFIGKWVKMDLVISKIHDNKIEFVNEEGVPLIVELTNSGSGYNLLVDDSVSITFTLTELGSCDSPYKGINGIL